MVDWVNKWNRDKDKGQKYGTIEIVTDATRADFLIVRFTHLRYSSSKLPPQDQIVDAFVYLLLPKPAELDVFGGWVQTITLGEYKLAAVNILDAIAMRMKVRAKEKTK